MRRVVREIEKEALAAMAPDKLDRMVGENVGQVASVATRQRAVAIELPFPVRLPSSAESRELVEAAPIRMIAIIERAVVPFANESGDVACLPQQIGDSALAQRQPIEATSFQGIDHSGPMRIAA